MGKILVLVRDLMFASKIAATARQTNVEIEIVRDPTTLAGRAGERLILDLNQDGTIAAAVEWKRGDPARVAIGFVSHVDAPAIVAARDAGIDRILARSQFVATLEQLLLQ